MVKQPPTVPEPSEAAEVVDQEIDAASAEMATEVHSLAEGWMLDLVEVRRTNTRAAEALTTDEPVWKRNVVRTAVLLAHPVTE
ncbi:hypothetical protein LOK46_21160 [Methylobacterium sp. NMS14P]|uniref:hypothetical protein n=1 Tax=Methylobacterium sp. NMS14P TaxID=2894310 RepID=UPI00235A3D58|nr:hypothetical protein [Methylobacterium sp. NMS14P]WCS23656.1 hypothetical protein LOK46_21160 [Methylobacterium sp. NMS14P]